MNKNRGLGRGLGALFPGARAQSAAEPRAGSVVAQLELDSIEPNRQQPRRHFDEQSLAALAQSIEANGLLAPILVRRHPEAENRYQIIAGERRWRAAKICGLERIPALIREAQDGEAIEIALLENVQRADLNAIEEAAGYKQLIDDHQYSQETLARRIGKSRPAVTNALRLLVLPDSVQALIRDGKLSAGHGRALAALPAHRAQALAQQAVRQDMSVRDIERAASGRPTLSPKAGRKSALSPDLADVESRLRFALATKVTLQRLPTGGGTIEIRYADDAELQRLLDCIVTPDRSAR